METADRPAGRLVLRAVLKEVSPIVARVISVPDSLTMQPFHDLFLAMLDWRADPDFILRVHGQSFASFRRRYRLRTPGTGGGRVGQLTGASYAFLSSESPSQRS